MNFLTLLLTGRLHPGRWLRTRWTAQTKVCLNRGYEPQYHQYEFDVRLYLTQLDLGGDRLWA